MISSNWNILRFTCLNCPVKLIVMSVLDVPLKLNVPTLVFLCKCVRYRYNH